MSSFEKVKIAWNIPSKKMETDFNYDLLRHRKFTGNELLETVKLYHAKLRHDERETFL